MKFILKLKNILFLLSLMAVLVYSGCRPDNDIDCPPDEYQTRTISQPELDLIPYSGMDTLKFMNIATKDTATFIGKGIVKGFNESTYRLSYECPGGHATLEYNRFLFVDVNNSNNSISIELGIYNRLYPTELTVRYKNNTYNTQVAELISQPYDSISILNRTYYMVKKFFVTGKDAPSNYYMLCNKEVGLIEFKLINGEKWDVIK